MLLNNETVMEELRSDSAGSYQSLLYTLHCLYPNLLAQLAGKEMRYAFNGKIDALYQLPPVEQISYLENLSQRYDPALSEKIINAASTRQTGTKPISRVAGWAAGGAAFLCASAYVVWFLGKKRKEKKK